MFPLLYLTNSIAIVGSARHRRKRERHWWRVTESTRLAFCPDYESWSVNQKREHYHQLHAKLSEFVGIPPSVIKSSMTDMVSFFGGGTVPYSDGYI
jgi:hypothetical protein